MGDFKLIRYSKFLLFLIRRSFQKLKEDYAQYTNYTSKGTFLFGNNHIQNAEIGEYSYVSFNSIIRNCSIGRYCSIGPNVVIGFGDHKINSLGTHPSIFLSKKHFADSFLDRFDASFKKVIIENDVWIGANVYVKNGVKISNGAIIGAGSVVVSDVPPFAIMGGVPARLIRYRFDEMLQHNIIASNWWNESLEDLKIDLQAFEANGTL